MRCQPKISVIVPVYNAERYLQHCLGSICNQTLQEIEVICVDDGSTDNSSEILAYNAALDKRIKILHQENQGAGAARNAGLAVAIGEYAIFLDSDDFFCLDMMERIYARISETDSDICIFQANYFDEQTGRIQEKPNELLRKSVLPESSVFSCKDLPDHIFNVTTAGAWNKIFRREFIENHKIKFQNLPNTNDLYFVFTSLVKAEKITYLDDALLYYRKNRTDSLQSFKDFAPVSFGKALTAVQDELKNMELYETVRCSFVNRAAQVIAYNISSIGTFKAYETVCNMVRSDLLQKFEISTNEESYFHAYARWAYKQCKEIQRRSLKNLWDEKYGEAHDIQPIGNNFGSGVIPVVYATDENYLKYVIVSMLSAVKNSGAGVYYRFIILIPERMEQNYRMVTRIALSKYHNCSVEFFEIGSECDNAYLRIPHITIPTYYRLLLPSLLPECERCIYIDGDTVICDSLRELFDIDIENEYVAGVPAFAYYTKTEYHIRRLEFNDKETFEYINAGVLLMNLDKMRQDHIEDRFIALMNNKFDAQDQDILNVTCRGKIRKIPFRFNVMTKYSGWKPEKFEPVVSVEEIIEGRKKPTIIHYADKVKPWNNLRSPYARQWIEISLSRECWSLFSSEKTMLIIQSLYSENITRSNRADEMLEREIKNIHSSASYRIGRAITFIPRKVRGGIRCYKEHGMRYTLRRVKEKFGALLGR